MNRDGVQASAAADISNQIENNNLVVWCFLSSYMSFCVFVYTRLYKTEIVRFVSNLGYNFDTKWTISVLYKKRYSKKNAFTFIESYCFYRFEGHYPYRSYQGSINELSITVPNENIHLSTTAGV